jgi:hypothetical protein
MPARIQGHHLVDAINGSPSFLGVIVATTTKNNHDTAAAFNNTGDALKGKMLLLQPDTACWIRVGPLNTQTASATATAGSIYLAARERVIVGMTRDNGFLACVAVSGTTNLQVHEMV